MYFDKYKDVTYNGIFLSEVCEIQDIKIPFYLLEKLKN